MEAIPYTIDCTKNNAICKKKNSYIQTKHHVNFQLEHVTRRLRTRPNYGESTGNLNAVLANRMIRCIYVVLANKIIRIYLSSCVFMSRFGRDLYLPRDS